jgi:hypothetical protein
LNTFGKLTIPKFYGVINNLSQLPAIAKQGFTSCIYNTGYHWIAIIYDKKSKKFKEWDSFGRDMIKGLDEITNKAEQKTNENNCGQRSLAKIYTSCGQLGRRA